jgi:photosystem II stability/assembly factor-like uncharacterized protein
VGRGRSVRRGWLVRRTFIAMQIERFLLVATLLLGLCGPARAQIPSASVSAATKSKGADVSLHKPAPQEDVEENLGSMKLLAPGIGWAEISVAHYSSEKEDHVVYWTTDNGKHWRNITPPVAPGEDLSDLFFLDTHHGWAIFERSKDETKTIGEAPMQRSGFLRASVTEETQNKLHLAVATTIDAGVTWSMKGFALALEDYFPKKDLWTLNSIDVAGIAFADQLHGWLQLVYWIGMHGHGSLLLVTSDGGKIWNKASAYPRPKFPDMVLVTPNEGWVFGTIEPDGEPMSLFVTRDGTKSWQELSAQPFEDPDDVKKWHPMLVQARGELGAEGATCEVHRPPVFQDPAHGFFEEDCRNADAVADIDGRPESMHTTVLFATSDGGRTWKQDRMLRNFAGSCNSSTVVDSIWIVPVKQSGDHALLRVAAGATVDAGKDNGSSSGYSMCEARLSFVTPAQGWMLADQEDKGALSSTIDGGRSWTTITPRRGGR